MSSVICYMNAIAGSHQLAKKKNQLEMDGWCNIHIWSGDREHLTQTSKNLEIGGPADTSKEMQAILLIRKLHLQL